MIDMTKDEEVFRLRDLHEEFLRDQYFTAFSIITPKNNWLCIDKNENNIESLVKRAEEKEVFNLVVKDSDKILGFINLTDIKEKKWDKMVSLDEFSISASLSLFNLVDRMVKDSKDRKRARSPLYFVHAAEEKSENLVGIITFWDLNRAPAYILSYPILVYLEHTLLLKIIDSHKEWTEHATFLSNISGNDRNGYIRKFLRGPSYNYKVLDRWGLLELLTFFKSDPHIQRDSSDVPGELLNLFNERRNFRNIIGHTVKLIIRDNVHFSEDLKELNDIWNIGKEMFENFIDPKVRHSSPIID
jgi:hypothetical protein